MKKNTELIVALDTGSLEDAKHLVRTLTGAVKYFKVGSVLFTACGPQAIEVVREAGGEIFLDLKFHDIPNTVGLSALSAFRPGVFMFNVHAMGGISMLRHVVKTVRQAESPQKRAKKPIILGVTVLTSMDRQQLNSIGVNRSVKNEVVHLAGICKNCGLDGVVCSGKEITLLRRVMGKNFILVVPGIRPFQAQSNDQKRIISPKDAHTAGADYIVVGRPITASEDPLKSAQNILRELNG